MALKKKSFRAGSLAEYMQLIKEEELENFIFRGEDRKYPSITAAAFRRSNYLDIQSMVDEFEGYIGNGLTALQKEHFLAFSQHYGLPTNLLDFTFSPLVSLYFACQGERQSDGYVYYLNQNRLISLTGHVDLIRPGLFTKLLAADERVGALYDGISNVTCLHPEYGSELLRCVDHMLGDLPGNEELRRVLRGTVKKMEKDEAFSIDRLDSAIKVLYRKLRNYENFLELPDSHLGSYGRIFACAMELFVFQGHFKDGFYLPFYFTYEPANITSRVPNQSSILIYQLYGINTLKQKIRPDGVISVENKTQMLRELDQMGINEKFIFNDYDHIASYIKEKHLRRAVKQDKTMQELQNNAETWNRRKRGI